jgi:hypothetical protein
MNTSIITSVDAHSSHLLLTFDQADEPPQTRTHRLGQHDRKEDPMSESSADHHHGPGRYEIRVKGHLSPRWAAWFDGATLTTEPDGTTVIVRLATDQAALHGLLQKVRDIGLPLVSVTSGDPDQPDAATLAPHWVPTCSPRRTT